VICLPDKRSNPSNMSVTHILADLRQRNITVRTRGDDLFVTADKGGLSPELRAILASHKREIVIYLQQLEEAGISEAIAPAERGVRLPLSFGQQRLWFLAQLEPDSPAYVIPANVRIQGPLKPTALRAALDQVVRRHEILRTVFLAEDGAPAQVILPEIALPFSVVDLRQEPAEIQEGMLAEWGRREARKPFDLSAGPLLRSVLLQLGEQEHVLLLTLHHIVADGWSIEILIRELSAFYLASAMGLPARLLPLPVQYADYAVWQQQWSGSPMRERQLSYWRRQLSGLAPLALVTDYPRLDRRSPQGGSSSFVVPGKVAERLRFLALQEDATLFMVLLAAFQVLLSRYTGQQQIAVGTPVANRERKEIEGLIGFFVNTLVLVANITEVSSFRELLRKVRKTTLEGFDNQDLPFEQLVDDLQPARSLNQNPLFQVMFMHQNASRAPMELGGIRLQPLSVDNQTAKFDVTMSLSEDGDELRGWLSYNADLFEPATIDRMIAHYRVLLSAIAEQPESTLATLPLLLESERRQLLVDWNQTATSYPQKSVSQLFEEQAARNQAAVAVEYQKRSVGYAEMNRRANQLAHYLQKMGVGLEDRVGICMERNAKTVVAVLAVLKAGGTYVPMDPSYPEDRLAFMVQQSQLSVILTQEKFAAGLLSHRVKIVKLDSEWKKIGRESSQNLDCVVEPENLAYVMFTSGSTGRPKGVMVTHKGLTNYLQWAISSYPVKQGKGSPLHTSMSFDLSLTSLLPALLVGQSVIVMEEGDELQQVATGLHSGAGFSLVKATPSHLHVFRELLSEKNEIVPPAAFVIGGEALSYEDVKWWREQAPATRLLNEYGPTETVVGCCVYEIGKDDRNSGSVSIGRPIANTHLYVLDQNGELAPLGVPGELYIGGAGLARGYVNRPDLTAERFVPDHLSGQAGERLYRTGDKARWRSDGNLDYLGRTDDQVKVRGHRIELGEIESVLMQHGMVDQAVVIARPDQRGDMRLLAYVVHHDKSASAVSALREYLRGRLPEYMAPAVIVELAELPLTSNGKVDRKALPDPGYPQQEQTAPCNMEEEILCGIFSEVLKLDQVGTAQNFFDAGGHSLLATQIISRVRNAFGVDLPLRALFEAPTVAGLAERLERARAATSVAVPPLARVTREQAIPLSFAQQRLWFLDQFVPNSPTYNSNVALSLQGDLNVQALESAFSEIVSRHEVLRTRMEVLQGQPRQVIAPPAPVSVPVMDLSPLPQAEQEVEIQRCMHDQAEESFDLARGPLLRMKLLRRSASDHVLLVTLHHIVSDGWSMSIMVREFSRLYEAHVLGGKPPLPELPLQYADYAVWQRNWLQGEILRQQVGYWKGQLAEAAPLEMPTDFPRGTIESEAGESLKWELSEELSRKLKELSRREGVTLFMTLLAAFQVLLARYSGQSDISIGSPIAGRTRTELEGLIGFFVNTLVLRTDLGERPTFRELMGRVREITLSAYAHQDVPFEKLVEELQPDRDLSRSPLFQAMFVLQNTPSLELELPALKLSVMERVAETVHFELLLSASEQNGKIGGGLSYRSALFSQARMRRLLGHWQNLLVSIVGHPQQKIGELEILSPAEHRQIVEEWNRTDAEYPREWVHQMVEKHAAESPQAIAVDFNGLQLTYAELNQRANQLAHYLRTEGVGPEVLVGVCMERSLDMTVGVLAVLKTGAGYVPLDPKYPPARLAYMLENSQIELLVTQQKFLSTFAGLVQSTVCVDTNWQDISRHSQANLNVPVSGENVAFVIYTSGSTGRPKGVAMRHGAASNLVYWHLRGRSPQPLRTLQFASLSFDVSFQDIFATWCAGGCLVLIEEDARRDPAELWRVLCDQQVARISVPFVALQQLAEAAGRSGQTASSLRQLISAGEQLRVTPALQKLLKQLPMCRLENQYGPSETHVVTVCHLEDDPERWPSLPAIGKAMPNTQVYLLNEEYLPAPAGVAGELYLAGLQLSRGYVNRPELTAERFVPNPFSQSPGARMYKTGDLARYLEDGSIEYLGRMDQQVKVRGYRIELGEVESALSECEGVGQAAVVIREGRSGEKRLVGYVVGRDGQTLSEARLRSDLKERLPEFMVPASVVVLEELPLTPSGKIDRKRLPESGGHAGEREEEYVRPRTVTEEILCGIWEELLKRERIGITTNFFEAGGHSLLATQVMARIGDVLHVELPVRRLFEAPTVAELAQLIEQQTEAGGTEKIPPIAKARRDHAIPLSFAQQRLWFLEQLQPGTSTYNLPVALRLTGELRMDWMERAFTELVARHESLRTTFSVQEGQPVQTIAPVATVSLPLTDLSAFSVDAAIAEARYLAEEEANQPFDLVRGPLLRVRLLGLAEQDHVLLLTMHHIVSDGWSMGIMVHEFSRLYEACCRGEQSPLPELPIQYADFSLWQREWLQGGILEEQLLYWKQRLAGVQSLELPADRPRPPVMLHAGSSMAFNVGPSQMQELKSLSRRQGTTLYMTLLAAFQTLLHRYSGQHDIAVGSPIAGRRRTETEGLIGFFINTLVMRTGVSADLSFSGLLQIVREVALGAYTHQDVPFEKVVEELQPERDLSRTPLFQVMFSLQNAPRSELQIGPVQMRPFAVDSQTAKFDLTLSLSEDGEDLQGWLGYYTALFDPATAARMIGHYCVLLNGIVQAPERPIAELPLLAEAERRQLLVEWNDNAASYPQKNIHKMFAEQALRTPAAIAVKFEGRHYSYAELNSRANQLGRYLLKAGVAPGEPVGICMERSLDLMVGLLGILKTGGAYVPLDPTYPAERLAFMLNDAESRVLLTQNKLLTSIPKNQSRIVCLDAQWNEIALEDSANLKIAAQPDSLAYIIYTSGSTGRPKGAMNTHGAIANRLIWMQQEYGLDESDRVMQKTPISFDVSVWELFWPLMTGAALVLARPEGHRDSDYLVDLIVRENITTIHFVPSMLRVFLEHGDVGRCTCLRRVIASGEALPADLESLFYSKLKTELHNLYGPTEAAVDVTAWPCPREGSGAVVPIGRPIANTQIYILDRELQPAPVGVTGEIYIGGAGLARGYLNRPGLTADRFVAHPFESGKRLYRVGDLGRYRNDGAVEFLGRVDHQEKIRGFRIELGEIESALRRQPEVHDTVVVAREYLPGDKRLVAYVVPDEQRAASVRTLARYRNEGHYDIEDLPNGIPVLVKNRTEAQFLYQEIFEQDSYAQHNITLGEGDCVFDVGANIGMFSLYIGEQCRSARIYTFEPIPELCTLLRKNLALWNLKAEVFDCGLSNRPGQETFVYYPHVTILSGSSADAAEEKKVLLAYELNRATAGETQSLEELIESRLTGERIDCEVKTISQVMRERRIPRIDLLKIDVEKSERKVLAGIEEEHWAAIRQVVVEVHDVEGCLAWSTQLLRDHGYTVAVEQETALRDTGIFVLYAVRPEAARQAMTRAAESLISQSWVGPAQLQAGLSRALAQALPEYMIPAAFVFLDHFPLLPNGKLDRKALPSPESATSGRIPSRYVQPQTAVEKQLAQIFSEILKKEPVGLHDNFFSLGGHSLLMFRLKTMIGARLSCDLPLSSLFQDPTVAGLARLLDAPANELSSPVLVAMQAGGTQAPLFCVHPVGGQVACYAALSRELGPDQPFYALQSPDPSQIQVATVEQMAGLYIQEIQRVQPSGPYLLGGWSMGGLIAFEMAHQLSAQGHTVDLLALFDTVPPSPWAGDASQPAGLSMLERFALDMSRTALSHGEDLREHFMQLSPREQFKLILDVLVREQVLPQDAGEAELNRLLSIFTRNATATDNYRLRPANQRIFLFPASGRDDPMHTAKAWEPWTTAGVELRAVPGDHYTMLKPPQVATLAEILAHCLASSRAAATSQ
jgi:amino acid adenylation domain-containing protein/FkbM family methyltransferase